MNLSNQENTSIFEMISNHVRDHSISLKDIERNTSLSYSTLNRSFNEKRDFQPLELAEIMNFLFEKEASLSLINQHEPNNTTLLNLLSDTSTKDRINQDQERLFTDPNTFALANMIELGYFKTVEQVKESMGYSGVTTLLDMESLSIVSIDTNGNIKSKFEKLKPNFNVLRKQISNSSNYHKDKNCGKLKNFIYFGTQLISKEKRTLIHHATRYFKEIISAILHNDMVNLNALDQLNSLLRDVNIDKTTQRTEPIFYSILLDDFKSFEDDRRVLQ